MATSQTSRPTEAALPHIVVVGCGFGGLAFARSFRGDAQITIVDKQNHHLFQPLLYQVAMAGLSAPEIAEPIRSIFRRRPNIATVMDTVESIDLAEKTVGLELGGTLQYDYLVLASGGRTSYFGNDQWAEGGQFRLRPLTFEMADHPFGPGALLGGKPGVVERCKMAELVM